MIIKYAGFNVGGADWGRPELSQIKKSEDQYLKKLYECGYKEAELCYSSQGNMLRTFIAPWSLFPLDHDLIYCKRTYFASMPIESKLDWLDKVESILSTYNSTLIDSPERLNWKYYDAYLCGIHKFNHDHPENTRIINVLLTLVDHPPRPIIEIPSKKTLAYYGRNYSFDSLWDLYVNILCELSKRLLERYLKGSGTKAKVISAYELINEPDYNWIPDEVRIEHSVQPERYPCDKYVTELHLSQIPNNDSPNKPFEITPWGFGDQDSEFLVRKTETPITCFDWGSKFDWYVRCFALLHTKLAYSIYRIKEDKSLNLTIVSGSVTHNNIDWLCRAFNADNKVYEYVDVIGVHPYHWPRHDIWDSQFSTGPDLSNWSLVSPRNYAANYFKNFNFIEQIARYTELDDKYISFGLGGKKIWVTEFGIPTKKLCEVNKPYRKNKRLFIYPRKEKPPDGIKCITWEDKWDNFLAQINPQYLDRNNVECFLIYTLREGLFSESCDENHSNFSIYSDGFDERMEEKTIGKLKLFMQNISKNILLGNTDLRSGKWKNLVGMTSKYERGFLDYYSANIFQGRGDIVELGCWLGSLTIPILNGLRKNNKLSISSIKLHTYDCFKWLEWMNPYLDQSCNLEKINSGDNFLSEFKCRVEPWNTEGKLVIHSGDLCKQTWNGNTIEMLVIDVMKSWELANHVKKEFYPFLIPGKSYIFHQDYCHFFEPWIHLIHYKLKDYFDYVVSFPDSAGVVFKANSTVPPELLKNTYSISDFTYQEIDKAFNHSFQFIENDQNFKKEAILAAKVMAYAEKGGLTIAHKVLKKIEESGYTIKGELKMAFNALSN